MDRAVLYTTLTIGASLALLLGREVQLRARKAMSGRTPSPPPRKAVGKGSVPTTLKPKTDPRLESELRSAILSADARERLVQDALRKTKGDRTAAIRRVLDDLRAENNR